MKTYEFEDWDGVISDGEYISYQAALDAANEAYAELAGFNSSDRVWIIEYGEDSLKEITRTLAWVEYERDTYEDDKRFDYNVARGSI